jgi:hypothetical protein
MALSLQCACGVKFEVEPTLAGQTVSCPECQQPVQAPARDAAPVKTSGWALASFVMSLVLAFTGIGSFLAAVFGVVALRQIATNRDRVTGTGYAVFGIILGTLCTGLFAFAVARQDILGGDLIRERLQGDQVDRSGPMEVKRPEEGFRITRPSAAWGIASSKLTTELDMDAALVLAQVGRFAFIEVTVGELNGASIDSYAGQVLTSYKPTKGRDLTGPRDFSLVRNQRLPDQDGYEVQELYFNVRLQAQPRTYWIWVVHPPKDDRVFVLRGWTSQGRFESVKQEIQAAFKSFRTNP